MEPDDLASQVILLEEIKRFSDNRQWAEIRPALFELMEKLSLRELEVLLEELKNLDRHACLRNHVTEYLKRHKIHSA